MIGTILAFFGLSITRKQPVFAAIGFSNKDIAIRTAKSMGVDPAMVQAMIQIESSWNENAERYEAHLNDSSKGLMQLLQGTANWLYNDMGYRKYKPDNLFDPATNIYFGCAMIQWLSNYKGMLRNEQWIVESYNGGPGNSNSQTKNHWRKYQEAKQQIEEGA